MEMRKPGLRARERVPGCFVSREEFDPNQETVKELVRRRRDRRDLRAKGREGELGEQPFDARERFREPPIVTKASQQGYRYARLARVDLPRVDVEGRPDAGITRKAERAAYE